MGLETFHIVQGLSRTPLFLIPWYLTNIFFKNILQTDKISRIDNLEIWNFKISSLLTSAQANKAQEQQQHEEHDAQNWAPVSEPGFLDFHISRLAIIDIFFLQSIVGKYVGEISRNK